MPDSEKKIEQQIVDSNKSILDSGNIDEIASSHKRTREEKDEESRGTSRAETHNETLVTDSGDKDAEESDGKGASKKVKVDETNGKANNIIEDDPSKPEGKASNGNGLSSKTTSDGDEKPKFVFGSGTSFGSGFGAFKKAGDNHEEAAKKDTINKPFAFGSGLSFGGGFGILKKTDDSEAEKKEVIKTEKKKETPKLTYDEDKVTSLKAEDQILSSTPQVTVKLQKQDIKSGEESEETIYQINAKLYQLSDLKEGWKERGVGIVRVNTNSKTEKSRLIMRSRGILKVILNLPLIKGIKIQKGFPGSLQSEKFIRMISVDDNKAPIQYAIKTGKAETISELYDNIVKLVPQ